MTAMISTAADPQRAAVLVMLLAEDDATGLLSRLSPEELRLLGSKMVELGEIGPGAIADAIAGFAERADQAGLPAQDRSQDVRRLMTDPSSASALHEGALAIAECIARRSGDRASSYLGGGLVGDPEYERISGALTGRMQSCARSEATATAIAISGALAEQLLAAKPPHVQDRAPAVNEDAAHRFFGELTGAVTFDFAGGGAIRLEVESINCELRDLSQPWRTRTRPAHESA